MKKYLAPLEGITGYIFRNAYNRFYGGIDKYFSPFISPADNCAMNPKEKRDVLPDNNEVDYLVPQIMTCKSHHFIDAANALQNMGYKEFNLNLGCPSGTVCAKGKGSGFLFDTDKLDSFLEDIYEYAAKDNVKISVKTRLGKYDPDEWYDILEIFNKYPISEVIIHPRIQSDFYKGEPRVEYYKYAMEHSKNPIVYNGNIFEKSDYEKYLGIDIDSVDDAIMFGRGLLYNPEMLLESEKLDRARFKSFHDEIYHGYQEIMSPDINVIYRMKELWSYWKEMFPESGKEIKKLFKCKKFFEYEPLVSQIIKH